MTDIPVIYKPKGPFPLWMEDFEADTEHLTETEKMAYLRVLVALWRAGGYIPADWQLLKKVTNLSANRYLPNQMQKIWQLLERWDIDGEAQNPSILNLMDLRKNTNADGRLTVLSQKRVRRELEKLVDIAAKRSKSGKCGADARYGKRRKPPKQLPKGQDGKSQEKPSTPSLYIESSSTPSPNSSAVEENGNGNVVPLKDRAGRGNDGGRQLTVEEVHDKLCDIIGIDPQKEVGFAAWNDIRLWIHDGCDPHLDIFGAVEDVKRKALANGSHWPPGSFAYFRRAVYQARDRRRTQNAENEKNEKDAAAVPAGGWSPRFRERAQRIAELKLFVKTGRWNDNWGVEPNIEDAKKRLEGLERERLEELRELGMADDQ